MTCVTSVAWAEGFEVLENVRGERRRAIDVDVDEDERRDVLLVDDLEAFRGLL